MLGFLGVMLGSFVMKPLDYGFDYSQVEQVSTQYIQHRGFASGDQRQAIIQKAYEIGGIDFVLMIECENGNRDQYAISKTRDYGICQLNYRYNKEFINSEGYKDVNKQLEYCYEKWKINPKLWYGPTRKINNQLCKDYVKDRFIF